MEIKDGWLGDTPVRPAGRLPEEVTSVIVRAAALTPAEIARLDAAERQRADLQLVAWDVLRSNLAVGDAYSQRLSARARAWAAVNASLRANGLATVTDDGYWRVTAGTGWGAARAARFAACALVAPSRIDPDLLEVLLRPWRSLEDPRRSPLA